jgi:hypothetical protein
MPRPAVLLLFLLLGIAGCIPETSTSIVGTPYKLDSHLVGRWTVNAPSIGTVSLDIKPMDTDSLAVDVRFGQSPPERFRAQGVEAGLVNTRVELTRISPLENGARLPRRFVIGYRLSGSMLAIYIPSSPPLEPQASADELRNQLDEIDAFGNPPVIFDRAEAQAAS